MKIPAERVKELREQSGAGIIECRNVLLETEGDMEKAIHILKEKNLYKAEKKKSRIASEGLVEGYIHSNGRVGAMVELNCETDFVARTDEFKELAHDLAMQVAAMEPQFIAADEVPEGADIEASAVCLLLQPFIKDTSITIQDIINQAIVKTGENIKLSRFARFELGE